MATQYIHFTEEQKQTARQTDIAELLRRQGQTLKRSGSEYEWKDGSAKVTVRGNLWFHQYDHEGGDAIDFVRRFMGKSYPEAVEFLLSGCGGSLTLSPPIQRQPPKPFVLPEKNEDMRRVYAAQPAGYRCAAFMTAVPPIRKSGYAKAAVRPSRSQIPIC